MKKPVNYELIEFVTEKLYQVGMNYLYLERSGIDGWYYALLDPFGDAIHTGYIDEFYHTANDVAIVAHQLLNLTQEPLKEATLTIDDILKDY